MPNMKFSNYLRKQVCYEEVKDINYKIPWQYGYGSHYEDVARDILKLDSYDRTIKFIKINNCKKKEMIEHGEGDSNNLIIKRNEHGNEAHRYYYCD